MTLKSDEWHQLLLYLVIAKHQLGVTS